MNKIIELAKEQASEARERALLSGDETIKVAWMDLARIWDRIGDQYADIQRLRDQHLSKT